MADEAANRAKTTGEREDSERVVGSARVITQSLLKQVESALARFENGTYGLCAHCGQPLAQYSQAVQGMVGMAASVACRRPSPAGCASGRYTNEGDSHRSLGERARPAGERHAEGGQRARRARPCIRVGN